MRWREVFGGLRMMLPLEQDELYIKVQEAGKINLSELTDCEQELARKMVSNGSLDIHEHNDNCYYTASEPQEIWRDK